MYFNQPPTSPGARTKPPSFFIRFDHAFVYYLKVTTINNKLLFFFYIIIQYRSTAGGVLLFVQTLQEYYYFAAIFIRSFHANTTDGETCETQTLNVVELNLIALCLLLTNVECKVYFVANSQSVGVGSIMSLL